MQITLPPSWVKSWKTSLSGIITGASTFVLFAQNLHYINPPGWVMACALFTLSGGLVSFGLTAKDAQVTGGKIGQPSTASALADANQAPAKGANAPEPAK